MPNAIRAVPRNYDDHAHWEVLNDLIGRIYECALDPTLWNETLAQITATLCPLNWESAFLIWESNNPPRAQFVAASGLAAGVQEMYTAVYAGSHDWSRRLMPYRNGSVVDTDELLSRQEFSLTKFARDFLVPWGIDRMVAVLLDRRGKERLGLMLPGPGDRDLDELKRGMRVLAPHIQRAVRISHRIASLELAAGAAAAATDHSPFGVLSLDADMTILSVNRRVARYAESGVISMTEGRLTFVDPAAQKKLIELARSAPPAGLAFQATARSGRELPVLGARIAPQIVRPLGGVAEGAALIITIGSAPGETPVVEINRVAQWYGLTPAEARLAVAISEGMSLVDYAAQRAVTTNSARFLLKGVFRKTGVTSQAQLAAMIARLPTEST
jgi:DNA-binding CsgD family transcriptional regulator/PAS domain-containing protein